MPVSRLRAMTLMLEEQYSYNHKRLSSLALMVEEKASFNNKRVSNMVLMIEYTGTPIPKVSDDRGPRWQIM